MHNKNLTIAQVNMSFKGIASFGRCKIVNLNDKWVSDFTILGVPYGFGVAYFPGARFAPREIRDLSTGCSFFRNEGSNGYWSIEAKEDFLRDSIVVDVGDVDLSLDTKYCLNNITDSTRKILQHHSIPVMIGGDHSISFPIVRGFVEYFKILNIIHIDAHLDYKHELCGVKYAQGSPLRRISELPQVHDILAIGCRGKRHTEQDYEDALNRGVKIITSKDIRIYREDAIKEIKKLLPKNQLVYVTIDIDFLDPAFAPGTGSPTPGGFDYPFLMEILESISLECNVVGFDFVEVNPLNDTNRITSRLATEIIVGFMSYIWKQKSIKK